MSRLTHHLLARLICAACSFAAVTGAAQSTVQIDVKTELPVELRWRDDFLGITHTDIDFTAAEMVDTLDLRAEGTKRLFVRAGDEARLFLIRGDYRYNITATDTAIGFTTPDPFHSNYDKARSIFSEYDLYRVSDDTLLQNLDSIAQKYDSIKASFPEDEYLHHALDYFLAAQSISPCIQSDRSSAVANYFQSLEDELVTGAPFMPDHPFYGNFLSQYYSWKPYIKAFAKSELPRGTPIIDRYFDELKLMGNDTIAQLALVYHANSKYKGEGSANASEFENAVREIASNPLHPATGELAAHVLARMESLALGKKLTDHSFADTEGDSLSISDFYGSKYILLDFWFVGCGPCKRDIPALKSLHEDFSETLKIIAVNPLQPMDKVTPYREKHEIPYTMAVPSDPRGIINELNVNAYPAYVVIDPEGHTALYGSSKIDVVRTFLETANGLSGGEEGAVPAQNASPMKR